MRGRVIATDRPRFHLCAGCVTARGLEAGGGAFARVAIDVRVTGACDDCGAPCDELEAWRRLDVPPPITTQPALPRDRDDPDELA
jgi:hypothetical protein